MISFYKSEPTKDVATASVFYVGFLTGSTDSDYYLKYLEQVVISSSFKNACSLIGNKYNNARDFINLTLE